MKRFIITLFSGILLILLCACGGGEEQKTVAPTPLPDLSPEQILTEEDVSAIVNYALMPQGGVKTDKNAKTVVYYPNPIGSQDSVQVMVRRAEQSDDQAQMKQEFIHLHDMRPRAEPVEGMKNAYIAFPYLCFYDHGYIVQITAGSGNDEAQKTLLRSLAEKARENLNKLAPATTEDEEFLQTNGQ